MSSLRVRAFIFDILALTAQRCFSDNSRVLINRPFEMITPRILIQDSTILSSLPVALACKTYVKKEEICFLYRLSTP